MIYRDYTLIDGQVSSRQTVDSRELVRDAVRICARVLRQARQNGGETPHGVPGMPAFTLRLGLPEGYPDSPGNKWCFTVGEPGQDAFQFNALIHADTPPDEAYYAIGTLLAISLTVTGASARVSPAEFEEIAAPLYEQRPLLLSTVMPVGRLNREVVMIAADFSKCLAAAWLEGL